MCASFPSFVMLGPVGSQLEIDCARMRSRLYTTFIGLFGFLLLLTSSAGQTSKTSALYYLVKYGYVQPRNSSSSLLTEEGLDQYLKSAIMDFQAFAGLNQTGVLDPLTEELMNTPRCGVKDIIGHGATARRKKRYVLQGSKWRVKDLTYTVSKYPSNNRLSKAEIDRVIKEAFSMWQDVTNLRFTRKRSGSVHIDIRFEKYEHGDGDPFDGAGGTLAHAYFPQYGGDVHVDDSEYWTIDSFKGTNLLQTMVHELGHSLGLSHSDMRDAIMAPFYKGWDPNLKLDEDDIQGIQALYGEQEVKSTTTARPTSRPTSSPNPDNNNGRLCGSAKIDAIFTTEDGNSYVFKGNDYWRLTDTSVAAGYPRRISDDWPGLPGNIDAAFTWKNFGATYFFKGNQYWKFENRSPSPDYPKPLSKGFPDIPTNVDTAFVWGGNGKIYFFKGSDYYKFDPDRTPHVQLSKYPRDVSMWGLPSNLDGALQWSNGKTYFFKNGQYWRFDDRLFRVDERADPPFPRNSGEWWFGCPSTRPLSLESEGVALAGVNEGDYAYISLDLVDYSETAGDEDLDAY